MQTKALLAANTGKALEVGAFGAPVMVVEGCAGYVFGSDRMDVVAHMLGEGRQYKGPLLPTGKAKL